MNSILANSTGTNCGVESAGTIGNGTFNISDDSSCGFGSSTALSDTIGDSVLPLLGSLQNNGGPTDTIALNRTALRSTQCRLPIARRPTSAATRGPSEGGNACDIGAFEGSFEASPTPTPDRDGDGHDDCDGDRDAYRNRYRHGDSDDNCDRDGNLDDLDRQCNPNCDRDVHCQRNRNSQHNGHGD